MLAAVKFSPVPAALHFSRSACRDPLPRGRTCALQQELSHAVLLRHHIRVVHHVSSHLLGELQLLFDPSATAPRESRVGGSQPGPSPPTSFERHVASEIAALGSRSPARALGEVVGALPVAGLEEVPRLAAHTCGSNTQGSTSIRTSAAAQGWP